jgi:hypothetical protein
MSFDLSGHWRPEEGHRVVWKDLAPKQPRDNPHYAMYKDVLDAIAKVLREDTQ